MLTVKCRNNFIYSSLYGQLMLYMYNWNRSQESCMVLAIFRPYLSPLEEELCMYTFGDICNRMCSFFPRWYIYAWIFKHRKDIETFLSTLAESLNIHIIDIGKQEEFHKKFKHCRFSPLLCIQRYNLNSNISNLFIWIIPEYLFQKRDLNFKKVFIYYIELCFLSDS